MLVRLCFSILLVSVAPWCIADVLMSEGRKIVEEKIAREKGWVNMRASITMLLKDKKGRVSTKRMAASYLENKGEGDRLLAVFKYPKGVKGTSFLNVSRLDGNDETWLYIPTLKRTKRIASNDKRASFMNSDYSYEDMSSDQLDEFDYQKVKEEQVQFFDCHVIAFIPKSGDSAYSKKLMWIDKEEYRVIKSEFYDHYNNIVKTEERHDFKKMYNGVWKASKKVMKNLQTQRSTILKLEDFEFGIPLNEDHFSVSALKRSSY